MPEGLDPHVRSVLEQLVTQKLAVKAEQLTMEAHFIRDLGADSLDMVDLVLSLEELLDLKISEKEIVHMGTVGDAIRYLSERLGAAKEQTTPLQEPGA